MTIADYAKLKKLAPTTVHTKIKRGIITPRSLVAQSGHSRFLIDSDLADQDVNMNGHVAHEVKNQMKKAQNLSNSDPENLDAEIEKRLPKGNGVLAETKPPEIPKPKQEMRDINGEQTEVAVLPTYPDAEADKYGRYRNAKTSSEEYRARKLELEVAELEGRLLDVNEVRKRLLVFTSEIRDTILNVPAKVAPLLVSIADPVEMETRLLKELNSALASLSRLEHGAD